ncbi:MAG: hypothetical protein J0H15_08175 [Xanthomonadales bacterium]|nr:hypothetical protein [Xanthomonadales bacterium]
MLRGIVVVLSLLVMAAASAAPRESSGVAPSGAWYSIAVPEGWQAGDALVLYQHGFNFELPDSAPGLGPLAKVMLDEGYAVAATGYSQRGWALFTAIRDNRELLGIFDAEFGAPGEIVPFGGSMGGLIALRLAEARGLPPVKGVYALCPAAAGARLWDAAIDLRLAYDVVCRDAGELPTGAEPLPWAFDLDMIPVDLDDVSDARKVLPALLPVIQCTGLGLPAGVRNGAMKRRLAQLMAFAGISDEDFFITNLAYATFVLGDLVRAPDKLAGRNPFTTAGVDYASNAAVESDIARIGADPEAAIALGLSSDFRGAIGTAKVLSIHTSRDQLVIPGNQDFLRARLDSAQLTSAIVTEDAPSHCGFTAAEGLAGWEALRAWKDGAAQPAVADLQQACGELVAGGDAEGPCRFDPEAEIEPFDAVVRPRPTASGIPVLPAPLPPPALKPPAHRRGGSAPGAASAY